MSNLALYLFGFAIIIGGLAWGAHALGVPPLWIGIGATVLAGIGIVSAVGKTRYREPSPDDRGSRRLIVDDAD